MLTSNVRRALLAGAAALLLGTGLGANAASDVADAAMRGDGDALARLIEQGADVDAAQRDGATALHWAAYRDDVEAVRRLLEAGADVTAVNRQGASPLLMASVAGNAEMIRLMLEAGADANEMFRNGETALMMAARTGNAEAIEVLLAHGAEIDAREQLRGTTALMWAAAYANTGAARLLIERGADVDARSAAVPAGRRPRVAPTSRDRIESYQREIAEAGTSAERSRVSAVDSGDDGESRARPRRSEDWGGLTPLVFAAREGDIETARILLAAGAGVNLTTEYGWTPLLTATKNRYYELAGYFLEHGADPNIQNKGGWSPLYIATDNRNIEGGSYPTRKPDIDHLEFIERLLAHGADPNVRMSSSTETRSVFTHEWLHEEGATPFLRAAQSGDLALMNLLLEHGADPHIATEHGVTPLMAAAGIGWVEGITYEWSREQSLEAIELLLELGADVNAQDREDQRSALMGAAHKGHDEAVRLLVEHGADLAAKDIGSRDSIHALAGVTWQAIDYADGLVRVGVQSAVPHPETAALLRDLMQERGLPVPPEGRTLDSICVTDLCRNPL